MIGWELPSDPSGLPVERSRVSHSDETPIEGDFLITPDGRFLLSGRGAVFALPGGE